MGAVFHFFCSLNLNVNGHMRLGAFLRLWAQTLVGPDVSRGLSRTTEAGARQTL